MSNYRRFSLCLISTRKPVHFCQWRTRAKALSMVLQLTTSSGKGQSSSNCKHQRLMARRRLIVTVMNHGQSYAIPGSSPPQEQHNGYPANSELGSLQVATRRLSHRQRQQRSIAPNRHPRHLHRGHSFWGTPIITNQCEVRIQH